MFFYLLLQKYEVNKEICYFQSFEISLSKNSAFNKVKSKSLSILINKHSMFWVSVFMLVFFLVSHWLSVIFCCFLFYTYYFVFHSVNFCALDLTFDIFHLVVFEFILFSKWHLSFILCCSFQHSCCRGNVYPCVGLYIV